jgi:hypothetical protein
MNMDELPIETLLVLVAIGWGGYLLVIVAEWYVGRRRHRRAARESSIADHPAKGGENGHVDDEAHEQGEHSGTEEVADHGEERRVIHGGIVRHPHVIMPPGIPSITERLDERWWNS